MYADQRFRATRRLPISLAPFGLDGWAIREFTSPEQAAEFFNRYQSARMPCWTQYQVHHGKLMIWTQK